MSLPDIKCVRSLSDEAINEKILDCKKKLLDLRCQQATDRLERSHEFKHTKHLQGQLLTVETERKLGIEQKRQQLGKGKKPRNQRTATTKRQSRKVDKNGKNLKNQRKATTALVEPKPLYREALYRGADDQQTKTNQQKPFIKEDFMNKIDVSLIQELGLLDQTAEPDLTKKAGMFIRVSNADWQPKENIQDYKETFRLKRSIGCIGSRRTIESLQNDPGVDYVEGSPQSSSWEFSAPTSLSKKPSKSANFLKVTNAEKIHAKEEPEKGNEAIVAIIDTNINILHPTFLGEGETTRFLGILDLTDLDHPIEYTQDEINSYISSFASKKSTKDIPQVLIDDCSMSSNPSNCRQGHGTHVASIAAGKAVGNFSGGVAPEAKIVVVIIPLSSDRFHDAYGKGIEYIQRIASKIPVVINISQGFNIGSHDGLYYTEWLFEDSLLEHGSEVGVAVVKSAGNERLSERHVKINLSNGTTISPITWNCIEDTRSNLAIEVWFDSAYELEFYLENPSGERSSVIRSNKTISETFPVSGNSYNISYRKTDLRNGASLVSIKLISGIVDYIQGEEWKLHINILNRKIKTESKDLHAWIDDTGSSRAIIFNAMTYLNQEVTVTTPGNASHIITVGSIRNLSENLTIDSHELSSIGPTRRGGTKPDLVAPGFNIFAACAGNHERPCPKSGTSMAAPQVTGAIALAYSAINKRISDDPSFPQPNATQIIKALTSSCYQPDGYSVDNFHGFGVLDIQHFFSWLGLT